MPDKDYIVMSIQDVIKTLMNKRWTQSKIAKKLGISESQVYYYSSGRTKNPGPKICLKIYEEIKIEGKKPLVDCYNNPEELFEHNEMEE